MVDFLRDLLARAEAGEILALCAVYELAADGAMTFRAFHGSESWPVKLVGELEVAKQRIIRRHCIPEDP